MYWVLRSKQLAQYDSKPEEALPMSAACYHGNQVVYITKVVRISLSPTKIMSPRRAGPVAQMKKLTSRFPLREGVATEEPVIERVLQSDGRLSVFPVFPVGRWLCRAFSVWC